MEIHAVTELLHKIKQTQGWPRIDFIRSLQTMILDAPDLADEDMQEVLTDIAYDLNFYDDSPDRDEEAGYYGDKKLDEIITAAIQKTEAYEAGNRP